MMLIMAIKLRTSEKIWLKIVFTVALILAVGQVIIQGYL
jgi:hypothetical protein